MICDVKLEHSFSPVSGLGSLNLLSHVSHILQGMQGKLHLQDNFNNRPLVLQFTDKVEDMHCSDHTEGLQYTL